MNRVFITGCGQGLGKALKSCFSCVIPHYRESPSEYPKNAVVGDITEELTRLWIRDALYENDINVFINNAAVYSRGNIGDTTDTEISKVISTNIQSQYLILRDVFRYFKSENQGFIVNINSLGCKNPSSDESLYLATKMALQGISKSLQMEALGTNIHILDVYVGAMKTRMTNGRDQEGMIDPAEVATMISGLVKMDNHTCYPNEIVIRRSYGSI